MGGMEGSEVGEMWYLLSHCDSMTLTADVTVSFPRPSNPLMCKRREMVTGCGALYAVMFHVNPIPHSSVCKSSGETRAALTRRTPVRTSSRPTRALPGWCLVPDHRTGDGGCRWGLPSEDTEVDQRKITGYRIPNAV